eukprot:SAG31_NODE_23869_length_494_cov_0.531646_1_plen_110_part_10
MHKKRLAIPEPAAWVRLYCFPVRCPALDTGKPIVLFACVQRWESEYIVFLRPALGTGKQYIRTRVSKTWESLCGERHSIRATHLLLPEHISLLEDVVPNCEKRLRDPCGF